MLLILPPTRHKNVVDVGNVSRDSIAMVEVHHGGKLAVDGGLAKTC
jgi:hypothetical protein